MILWISTKDFRIGTSFFDLFVLRTVFIQLRIYFRQTCYSLTWANPESLAKVMAPIAPNQKKRFEIERWKQ